MTSHDIHVMDCRLAMSMLIEPKSVHTVVTSPPYFGLRDYGHDGQIGLEPTPEEFVAALVEVFREVRRVLRDDGTVWLNLGDSYATQGGDRKNHQNQTGFGGGKKTQIEANVARRTKDIAAKQLMGIPWRVAFALQADGWYLRQDIIWHKPNPMPESVRDRCTKAHEYIFMLSKSQRYYFDADSIAEPVAADSIARNRRHKTIGRVPDRADAGGFCGTPKDTRNKRSVWTVTAKPFKGKHFATFPPDLIEPCVLAGCPEGGTVLDPFGGAGTTGLVAKRTGRNSILCELNAEYAAMARARIDAA